MLSAGNQMLGETEQMCSVITPQLQELQVKVKKKKTNLSTLGMRGILET